jgi:hypothetical protein
VNRRSVFLLFGGDALGWSVVTCAQQSRAARVSDYDGRYAGQMTERGAGTVSPGGEVALTGSAAPHPRPCIIAVSRAE